MLSANSGLYNILCYSAKLHHNAAAVHIPIGLEGKHEGVIDIVSNRAVYFEGDLGWDHKAMIAADIDAV